MGCLCDLTRYQDYWFPTDQTKQAPLLFLLHLSRTLSQVATGLLPSPPLGTSEVPCDSPYYTTTTRVFLLLTNLEWLPKSKDKLMSQGQLLPKLTPVLPWQSFSKPKLFAFSQVPQTLTLLCRGQSFQSGESWSQEPSGSASRSSNLGADLLHTSRGTDYHLMLSPHMHRVWRSHQGDNFEIKDLKQKESLLWLGD